MQSLEEICTFGSGGRRRFFIVAFAVNLLAFYLPGGLFFLLLPNPWPQKAILASVCPVGLPLLYIERGAEQPPWLLLTLAAGFSAILPYVASRVCMWNGSPCIDTGYNLRVPSNVTTDMDGHLRFEDDPASADCRYAPGTCGSAPIIDMGAYEAGQPVAGDLDGDQDVDPADFATFQACISGPAVAYVGECAPADFDHDLDIDQSDFGIFQRCFSGEANPADPKCAR